MQTVQSFVEGVGHSWDYHEDKNGKKVLEILENNMIDVIAADKNISSDEQEGIKLISKIRRKNPYTDILFYSGQGITDADKKQLEKYAFIEIIDDKEISNPLMTMVKKNLSKWDDISYLRGIVISLIIDIENLMNTFIMKYYKISGKLIQSFETNILQNRYFSYEGKKSVMSKLINKEDAPGLMNKLEKLQCARNELAHSVPHKTKKNCLIIDGTDVVIDKNKVAGYYEKGKDVSNQLEKLIERL